MSRSGSAYASWFPGGGSGGSSTGSGLLLAPGVCGQAGGPVAGQTSWTPAAGVLVGATLVNVIIINNSIETNVTSSPYNSFSFNSGAGSVDRAPVQFVNGDTIIVLYKPA